MKKKGFTLVELLAVIVILAIIALIAVPIIMNVVESSRKGAATSSAYGYIKGVNITYANELLLGNNFELEGTLLVDENGNINGHKVDVEGTTIKGGYLTYSNGKITEGCLTIGDYKVSIQNDSVTETIKGACEVKETEPKESPIEWFTFVDNDDGTATITGLSQLWHDLDDDSKYDISIPSKTPSGNIVTIVESENDGFWDPNEEEGYGLTSVIIPDSVIEIVGESFAYNNLTSLDLGNGVQTIDEEAFSCNNLTSVTIPNSVITIGYYAFYGNNLTGELIIPSSATEIGDFAFAYNNLTSVTISESVTTIGESAFEDNNLISVIIPKSVTEIGKAAFNGNLLPDAQAFIYKRTNDGREDKSTIVSYGGANKTPTIPESVTTIGHSAFQYNNLTSVTIPNSVTEIETLAFYKTKYSNPNLTKIINKTGKAFYWGSIVNGSSGYNFETGTIKNSAGDVEVTNKE